MSSHSDFPIPSAGHPSLHRPASCRWAQTLLTASLASGLEYRVRDLGHLAFFQEFTPQRCCSQR